MNVERALLLLMLSFAWSGFAAGAMLCSGSATSMSLGTYIGDTSAPVDSIGSFVVRCTRDGGPAGVTVTMGIGASATSRAINPRQMRLEAGTDVLSYNLYRDASRLSVWGETVGIDTLSRTLTVPNKATVATTFNIYGRITGQQDVRAGSYADTLVVTIAY